MHQQTWLIGLMMLATTGSIALPTYAAPDNDTVTIQESRQDSTITGNHNFVEQNNRQVNLDNTYRWRTSSGNTQRSDQITDVQGNNNTSSQDNEQININSGHSHRLPRTNQRHPY